MTRGSELKLKGDQHVYEYLESKGFEVLLVNARHVKNLKGRKTDVADCQWLQQLHSHGLLSLQTEG